MTILKIASVVVLTPLLLGCVTRQTISRSPISIGEGVTEIKTTKIINPQFKWQQIRLALAGTVQSVEFPDAKGQILLVFSDGTNVNVATEVTIGEWNRASLV